MLSFFQNVYCLFAFYNPISLIPHHCSVVTLVESCFYENMFFFRGNCPICVEKVYLYHFDQTAFCKCCLVIILQALLKFGVVEPKWCGDEMFYF